MPDRSPTMVLAGSRPWNRPIADQVLAEASIPWVFASNRDELTEALEAHPSGPVYFLHWSWIVPSDVFERSECVVFHMTDVPYGRGGSPLQNLIQRGHRTTVLSALRMTGELDGGPVYEKRPLSLAGTAQETYERATMLACEMIRSWETDLPVPVGQQGHPTVFSRRTPEQSEVQGTETLEELHDMIRMLDADGYPKAFVTLGGLRLELSRSSCKGDALEAAVVVTAEPGASR
jgi:methionyl-tRNA formyltransferase